MKRRSIFISVFLFLLAHGVCGVVTDGLTAFVMEGDSVALHTNVETNQQEDIKWYFKDTRIAQISGDLSFICTDVQCNEGTERFRDRLQLDDKTGSLTITDIRTTDSGLYALKIISIKKSTEKTFNVTVYDARCKDCDERFILDHQTGSLTVMNTRITDSGEYKLLISSSRFSITRSFRVTVTGSGLSAGQIAGICAAAVGVLLTFAFVCVFYLYKRRQKRKDTRMKYSSQTNGVNKVVNGVREKSSNHTNALLKNTTSGLFSNHIEIESEAANEIKHH